MFRKIVKKIHKFVFENILSLEVSFLRRKVKVAIVEYHGDYQSLFKKVGTLVGYYKIISLSEAIKIIYGKSKTNNPSIAVIINSNSSKQEKVTDSNYFNQLPLGSVVKGGHKLKYKRNVTPVKDITPFSTIRKNSFKYAISDSGNDIRKNSKKSFSAIFVRKSEIITKKVDKHNIPIISLNSSITNREMLGRLSPSGVILNMFIQKRKFK